VLINKAGFGMPAVEGHQAVEEQPAEHHAHLGNRLADMAHLSWREALDGEGTILRLSHPDETVLRAVQERFGLDELHIKDILNPNHPPHFTRLDNGVLHIILRFPLEEEGEESLAHSTSISILADVRMCALIWPGERYHRLAKGELAGLEVGECVSKIIHILVNRLLHRVYELRDVMDEFEDACLEDVGKADLNRLLDLRKDIATLARMAHGSAIAIEQLMLDSDYAGNVRLVDAHEHMQRAMHLAEARAEHALNIMQVVQSLLSQRLNDVMKFLAVITVVMTPMGIIAGIFGMNFTHMDVLASPYGFAASIWGMLLLGLGLAVFFKLRKWW